MTATTKTTDTMVTTNGSSSTNGHNKLPASSVKMAYLGPPGTYGEQAAREFASRYESKRDVEIEIELVPCPTISDIYNHSAELHVMPLENTIQGGVIETLDCLLSSLDPSPSSSPKKREILMDLALPIRHCLVVKKGTRMEDIKWVRSHEQALGQSASFLAKHLPNAKLEQWPSTAGAAVSLLSTSTLISASESVSEDEQQLENNAEAGAGAAICSKGVVRLYPELEILYQGTQAIEHNYTRFLLLGPERLLPSAIKQRQQQQSAHPSAQSSATHFFALSSLDALPTFAEGKGRSIRAIHTRPVPSSSSSSTTTLFPSRYLVQLDIPINAADLLQFNKLSDSDACGESVKYLGSIRDTITEAELASL